MSAARKSQFGSAVPSNTFWSDGLHVFARLIDGWPPAPKKTFMNDIGKTSMLSSSQ
jgi:hypothetical protein